MYVFSMSFVGFCVLSLLHLIPQPVFICLSTAYCKTQFWILCWPLVGSWVVTCRMAITWLWVGWLQNPYLGTKNGTSYDHSRTTKQVSTALGSECHPGFEYHDALCSLYVCMYIYILIYIYVLICIYFGFEVPTCRNFKACVYAVYTYTHTHTHISIRLSFYLPTYLSMYLYIII